MLTEDDYHHLMNGNNKSNNDNNNHKSSNTASSSSLKRKESENYHVNNHSTTNSKPNNNYINNDGNVSNINNNNNHNNNNNNNTINPRKQRVTKKLKKENNNLIPINVPQDLELIESIHWNVKEQQCILANEPLGTLIYYTLIHHVRKAITITSLIDGKIEHLYNKQQILQEIQEKRENNGKAEKLCLIFACDHSETFHGICVICNGDCTSHYMMKKLAGEELTFQKSILTTMTEMSTMENTLENTESGGKNAMKLVVENGSDGGNNDLSSSEEDYDPSAKIVDEEVENTKIQSSLQQQSKQKTSHVSFLHQLGYTIHVDKALEIDRANQNYLLHKKKKLSLVLDLDHTLLHTISDFIYYKDPKRIVYFSEIYERYPAIQKYVHKFKMSGAFHFVRFRPGLTEFLLKCSKMYEMHIFTHGQRIYADKIASMIDPDRKLFSDRVVSREECPDIYTKTLSNIFPCSDNTVLVIDDKTDVWKNNVDNVIQIAPYDYFKRIFGVQADINNAPGNDSERASTNGQTTNNGVDKLNGQNVRNYGIKDEILNDEVDDDQLDVVYDMLTDVYNSFFENEETKDLTECDVKELLKLTKKKILSGCHILFSGVIPLQQDPKTHHIWQIAEILGAKCYTNMHPNITHLVARQRGTEKVKQMENTPGVYVVHLSWLQACLKYHKRINEFDYFMSDGRLALSEHFSKCKKEIKQFQDSCKSLMEIFSVEYERFKEKTKEEETIEEDVEMKESGNNNNTKVITDNTSTSKAITIDPLLALDSEEDSSSSSSDEEDDDSDSDI